MSKLKHNNPTTTTFQTQAGKFTTTKIVNVNICLKEFSAKIMTCEYHVDDFDEGRYVMILGRYFLTAFGLNIEFSNHIVIGGCGPYKGCLEPIFDVNNY